MFYYNLFKEPDADGYTDNLNSTKTITPEGLNAMDELCDHFIVIINKKLKDTRNKGLGDEITSEDKEMVSTKDFFNQFTRKLKLSDHINDILYNSKEKESKFIWNKVS